MTEITPILGVSGDASASEAAEYVMQAYGTAVHAFIEVGRRLMEVQERFKSEPGRWSALLGRDGSPGLLPFGKSRVYQFIAIAKAAPRFVQHVGHLPADTLVLSQLASMDSQTFERRLAEGTIRPDMQRREVQTGGARSIMASREQPKGSLDYFPTPPFATRTLMNDVLPHLRIDPQDMGLVAEPCCGEGHMSGVLQEYGLDVRASDIADYSKDGKYPPGWVKQGNYLDSDDAVDWTIFNPPFGDVTQAFVLHALEKSRRGVSVFVRQQWLEGIERYETIFRDRPPTLYAQFAERVPLVAGKWDPISSTATAYCWLVWVKDMAPQPPFWIPPGRKLAYRRDDDVRRFTAHPVIGYQPVLAPFATSEKTDAIIRAAYGAEVIDFEACIARLAREAGVAASKLQIRRRANQLKLGDRDRQREAVRLANAARAEP